ncbi:hypothetical protein [Streptomyces sp. NPDC000405]|uniref:hypothetical protein n=1 Tax=Streptomyces sp. NPDC000405 TaxID=3161033 RepID=UPI00398CFE44
MSALSPRRRSALRAAITTAALAGAVLAPATAAFAAEPAAPAAPAAKTAEPAAGTSATTKAEEKKAETATGTKKDAGTKAETGTKNETGAKAGTGTKAKTETDGAKAETGKGEEKVAGTWWLRRTLTLSDGSVAKVYQSGPETHRVDIISGGEVVKSVKADGRNATFEYNGMELTLTALTGEVLGGQKIFGSWWLHDKVTLADGSLAKVYESGPETHRVDIISGGEVVKSVKADGRNVTFEYNGMTLTLTALRGEILNDKGGAGQGPVTAVRYAGNAVYIGNGMVAVLRNDPEAGGPEAWIRHVGEQWKPGDKYMVRVVGKLDRENTSATIRGLELRLVDAEGSAPVLEVSGDGGTKTFALPKGQPAGKSGASTGSAGGSATQAKAVNASAQLAQTKAIPQGGVAAGAEGVGDGNDTMLLAAGGALASVSAAGVAFAVLRRRVAGSAA